MLKLIPKFDDNKYHLNRTNKLFLHNKEVTMNWQHNAIPFVPALALNDDWTDYTIDDLKKLCGGNSKMIQVTLTDNSMYDRYYKDDLVNIACGVDMPENGDALIRLPDDSVIFRCYTIDDDKVTVYPFFEDFEAKQTYNAGEITLIGLAKNVVRIG